MKIGILTFHSCINYGSYWQAACLVQAVQNQGHQVYILNHQSKKVNIAEWKCALQPVLPTPVSENDLPLYKQKIRKFSEMIHNLPLSNSFSLEHPDQMENFDVVIVGSDEVWNFVHPWYGYYPIFFGDGIQTNQLISYAASFGNYDTGMNLDKNWIGKLQLFKKISVRDGISQQIIKDVLGREPALVLDPCLLSSSAVQEKPYPYRNRYALVYGHNFSETMIQNSLKWARIQKLLLLSIGYRNEWADDQAITADPHEFAFLMRQSEAIITNFFHGCIFALINSKPFVCETSLYRTQKILDLLKRIDGEKYLNTVSTSQMVFNDLLLNPLEENIHRNIRSMRKFSEEWLKGAINSEKR